MWEKQIKEIFEAVFTLAGLKAEYKRPRCSSSLADFPESLAKREPTLALATVFFKVEDLAKFTLE